MNELFAKVNHRKDKYRTLISGVKVYEMPTDLVNAKSYDPGYKLEDDEWYVLVDFSLKDYCLPILKEPFDTTGWRMINKIQPEKMEYICSYQNENEFYFQRVYKSSILEKKRYLHIGDDIRVHEEKHGLFLNDIPDAVYIRDEDCLYFKKLETISPIFKGIDNLYREASREEVEQLLGSSFIRLGEKYHAGKVGLSNRHRITVAIDTLSNLSPQEQNELFTYTSEYYPGLQYDGQSFCINNDTDLKTLMYGIGQRFYTTRVTHERRVANSVSNIDG